jgi:hypothetical protein
MKFQAITPQYAGVQRTVQVCRIHSALVRLTGGTGLLYVAQGFCGSGKTALYPIFEDGTVDRDHPRIVSQTTLVDIVDVPGLIALHRRVG